jgi:NAD(P)-dependent dehydrogenase (short-subunit alcohol dehydrogenase family)
VRAVGVGADVATAAGCEAVLSAARESFGGADILVNNAGQGSNETIEEATDEKWQYYWDLHVMAAVRLSRGMIPMMRARGGGVILQTASICSVQPLWYEPIYNTTKAALRMFSKTLATECVKDGIRVNVVNPGLILTPDWIKTAKELSAPTGGDWEGYLQGVADEYAEMKRFGTPEELADTYVFLCSDRASYTTGSTVWVDGRGCGRPGVRPCRGCGRADPRSAAPGRAPSDALDSCASVLVAERRVAAGVSRHGDASSIRGE